MHWFARSLAGIVLASALAVSGAGAKEKNSKAKKEKKSKDTGLNVPIPVDHDAEGLRIPSFDETGKLQMYFTITHAKRTDEDHLAMSMAKVETFDGNGARQMLIEVPRSVLDLKTRIVTSDSPVKITRSDFELTGDTMIFNTQTRMGRFVGNVRMLIFNREEMAGGEDAAPEKKPAGASK